MDVGDGEGDGEGNRGRGKAEANFSSSKYMKIALPYSTFYFAYL